MSAETPIQSYTVILYDIPFSLPLQVIAEALVPQEKTLAAAGSDKAPVVNTVSFPSNTDLTEMNEQRTSGSSACTNTTNKTPDEKSNTILSYLKEKYDITLVPYALQVFKEPLPKKMGVVTYIPSPVAPLQATSHKNCSSSGEMREDVHRKIMEWIKNDLSMQLAVIQCKCVLAQPSTCVHGAQFFQSLGRQCDILRKSGGETLPKLAAFLVSKLQFLQNKEGVPTSVPPFSTKEGRTVGVLDSSLSSSSEKFPPLNVHSETESGTCMTQETACMSPFAELSLTESTFAPIEVVWLKKILGKDAPSICMVNGDIKTSHLDLPRWRPYLSKGLQPLIRVV